MTTYQPSVSPADERKCKGCSASVNVSEETIAQLVNGMVQVETDVLTSEGDFVNRMSECHRCDSLQFGTTCRWCGCLVAVKAKKAQAKCPHPAGSRW